MRNAFLDTWRDRERDLRGDAAAREAYRVGAARDDLDVIPVWVGQAVDLITAIEPAAEIVAMLVSEAERALARASHVDRDPGRDLVNGSAGGRVPGDVGVLVRTSAVAQAVSSLKIRPDGVT
jgi:hypothetical protein